MTPATREVSTERHGLDPQQWGTVTLDELQEAAVEVLKGMDQRDRIAACGTVRVPVSDKVVAYGDSEAEARYMTGVCSCGNRWLCARCAFSDELEVRLELEEVMGRWMDEEDGRIYLLNVTIPHSLAFSLEELNRVLLEVC